MSLTFLFRKLKIMQWCERPCEIFETKKKACILKETHDTTQLNIKKTKSNEKSNAIDESFQGIPKTQSMNQLLDGLNT